MGRAGFAVPATPGVIQYAQVTAELAVGSATAAWIVQNVPLLANFNTEQSGVNLARLGGKAGTKPRPSAETPIPNVRILRFFMRDGVSPEAARECKEPGRIKA